MWFFSPVVLPTVLKSVSSSSTHTLVYFGNNRPINLNAGGSAYHVSFDQSGSDAEQVGGRSVGEDKPHNNLQPSIVVYRWRRIA